MVGGGEESNQGSYRAPGLSEGVALRSTHEGVTSYLTMCIGCCRPICYGEKEQFVGCPAGRYFTTVATEWTNQSGCQRCPFNSYSPLYSTSIYDCTCNAGYTGPAGGPCSGTHNFGHRHSTLKRPILLQRALFYSKEPYHTPKRPILRQRDLFCTHALVRVILAIAIFRRFAFFFFDAKSPNLAGTTSRANWAIFAHRGRSRAAAGG